MPDTDSPAEEDAEKSLLKARIKALETDLRQKKEIILAQHTKLEAFFDSSIDALVQMDFDGHITGWNQQAAKIFGWTADEILDQRIENTIIPVRYRAAHRKGMKRFLDTGESTVLNTLIEIHALHRNGHEFPVEMSLSVLDSPDLQEFNAYIRDISERKHAETVIWNQANFDSLTSLPNRNLFLQKLEHEIRSCDRSNQSLALMYLDLDRFKDVNDSLGHDMGDLLLIEIANRLKKVVREIDTVSRLSGDEFTIILGNIDDQLSVQPICQELLDTLAQPFQLDNEKVFLTASIGVTFYPQDSKDIENLQRNADQAMYAAKAEGSNRFNFFTPELQQRALRKRKMIGDLRKAIDNQQFKIYYQPIVDLSQDKPIKAEALLRWHHPESGMVSPAVFIPIAEETGLISEIGSWVFYNAIEKAGQWRERFNPDFQISINTSSRQWIDEAAAMNQWFAHLDELGISGQAISVEITEGLLVDARDKITNRLLDFRDAEIQIAIDDFGTGYTSLSYLKQFDIDYLKIDQSFVRNLDHEQNDLALCEAIIVMAKKLGIKVIAEGVETENQDRLLKEFGCDFGQGYLYSRPVPAPDFEILLDQWNQKDKPGSTKITA
ncbi:MAG: EAL domain-containing protein [Gammaproteobacteria bacterium]|jgi:diguanylate cyclase (GGDEF)-like protein/PAS domain S-box-containing protein|nr:EAL domain-containing protein [Gammaproteobacteria bacterium]